MKKVMVCTVFCLITFCVFGQEVCRYLHDKKLCYEISVTKMLVKSETLDSEGMKHMLQNTFAVNLVMVLEVQWGGLYLVEIRDTSMDNMLELQRQLSAREDIVFVSPIYQDEGFDTGYMNEVIVRLKSIEDYPVLLKCAEAYQIKDIVYEELLYAYILTLPHNPEKDAAETAIELHETGLFVYASPSSFTLFPFESQKNTRLYKGDASSFVYPNPVRDVLYVNLEKMAFTTNKTAATFNVLLYDRQGKRVHQAKAKGGEVQFNVSNLPSGIYFLNIYDDISAMPEVFKVFVKQ